jgi:hypothetical protein
LGENWERVSVYAPQFRITGHPSWIKFGPVVGGENNHAEEDPWG